MVTPTTWLSAFILLLLSICCFASWPVAFKRAGRWRFELFSCDFAAGALIFSLLAAYTLGTLGSALGFGDRILVAGRTDQALAVVAGACFALANMLFLSSVSLIGMAAAFPLTVGTACVVVALSGWRASHPMLLLFGITLVIVTVVLDAVAIKKRGAALAASAAAAAPAPAIPVTPPPVGAKTIRSSKSASKNKPGKRWRMSTKGILVGVIGGLALGVCLPIIYQSTFNEFGLAPYAGLLLFCLGLFGATLALNIYFMNIAIHGGPLTLNSYFNGNLQQHLLGFAGGAIWGGGTLALGLALYVPAPNGLSAPVSFIVPPLTVLLAMFWGSAFWKEYASAPAAAKRFLFVSAAFFIGGIALLGLGAAH